MRSRAAQTGSAAGRIPDDRSAPETALDGRLARIRGENILFSQSQKAVFVLNDTAADIWRCLEEGIPPGLISAGIADRGFEPGEAVSLVEAALGEWERLGLLRPCLSPSRGHSGQVIEVAGVRIRVVYPESRSGHAREVFRHLEVPGGAADAELRILDTGSLHHLFLNGDWMLSCAGDELPAAVRGLLLNEVLSGGSYELALHAACMHTDDGALLLCGSPGEGKTTLALALAHAGLDLAGDDVVLLDAAGRCMALPFAPAVKEGAWSVLKGCCPGLGSAPIFRCPDGRRVRYPVPATPVSAAARPVRRVVLLRRCDDIAPGLEPISPAEALRGLLDGFFARDGELSVPAFDLLTGVIESADACRLTYSGADEAVGMLMRTCR